jgi:hypothetical protein
MFAAIRTNSSSRAAGILAPFVFLALPAATDAALAQQGVIGWGRMVFDSRYDDSFVEWRRARPHAGVSRYGSIVAWGDNLHGQCNAPVLPPVCPTSRWQRVGPHIGGARSDAAWWPGATTPLGNATCQRCRRSVLRRVVAGREHTARVAATAAWRHGAAIGWPVQRAGAAAGSVLRRDRASWDHTIACRSDGSAVVLGLQPVGQCNVPALPPVCPYVRGGGARATRSVSQRWQRGGLGLQRAGPVQRTGAAAGLSYVRWRRRDRHTIGASQ